jgi:predicted RNA binding protein YcfA (HicA-like mRNA interferase family)
LGNIPVLEPRHVVALLQAHGFAEVRQRGSHTQLRSPGGRCTISSYAPNGADVRLTVEELLNPR